MGEDIKKVRKKRRKNKQLLWIGKKSRVDRMRLVKLEESSDQRQRARAVTTTI
jgi:hypothetical protein